MKKVAITMMALTLIFTAGSIYACGNHEKASANSSKADASCGQAQTASADVAIHHVDTAVAKNSEEARVMTTEAHGCAAGSGAACPMNSNGKASGKADVGQSAMKTDQVKDVKTTEKSQPAIVVSGPVDLSGINQR